MVTVCLTGDGISRTILGPNEDTMSLGELVLVFSNHGGIVKWDKMAA